MTEFYNHHYIRTDASGNITEGWSDGPHNHRTPTEDDICITEQGGYQFRLFPDGEENPPLRTMDGIPLYRWTGSEVVQRTEDEIEGDRAAIAAGRERRARLAELHKALADTDYIAAKIAEGAATREDYADMLSQRQAWRDEINELTQEE